MFKRKEILIATKKKEYFQRFNSFMGCGEPTKRQKEKSEMDSFINQYNDQYDNRHKW